MSFKNHLVAFARLACSASSLRRYVAVSTATAAAQPKTKPLIHSVSLRGSRLLFACAPLLLGTAALVPAAPAQAQVVNICDRTAQVETAILAALSHNDCSAVTSTELAGIGGLGPTNKGIASLQANDFSGLSGLTGLNLRNNALTSLPDGVFSGLSSLTGLNLGGNALTSLPEGVFSGLSSLTRLSLDGNALTNLSAGVFSGLSNLEDLSLGGNALTVLPAGVFSGLSNLEDLSLGGNALTVLPAGVFSGLSNLDDLSLDHNALTTLPAEVFSGLSKLEELDLDSNALTNLPEGVFSGLSSLYELDLSSNGLTTLPAGVFSGLSKLADLSLHSNRLTSLPDGVFSGLLDLGLLRLDSNGLTILPAGVFGGLSSLYELNLSGNGLTSLPEGVFSGLSSLYELDLSGNGLTTLPSGTFSGLSDLEDLNLHSNGLTSLPVGVFSGLSKLRSVRVSGNPGAPFQLALSLEVDSAASTIRILAPLGAPEDLVIPLSFSGGTVAGSANATVTVATGATTSPLVTVVAEGVVTVSFGTLPALTPYSGLWGPGIDGLTLVAGDTVSYSAGICGLTEQVRTAIRAKLGDKACTLVTGTDLAGISGTLSINSVSIASLQVDDFNGLTSLEGLELRGNQLASLPTGIFSDLDSLASLDLGGNSITNLPARLLSNLTGLTALNLSGNSLTELPVGVFVGLSSLSSLNLDSNALTGLPSNVFGDLTGLTTLSLNSNQLASLPDAIFNSPGNLTSVDLSGNPGAPFTLTLSLTAGDGNTVRVRMTPSAWTTLVVPLSVENGTLSASSVTIPQGASLSNVATFTPDSDPDTASTVSIDTPPTLPTNFTGIALSNQVVEITIQGGICSRSPKVQDSIVNALSGVSNCGAVTDMHLASLTGTLTLSASGATTLQAGDFAGLSGLTGLDLANRSIASLPQDVFGELAKLTTLNLSGNSLTELPAGVFVGLSSLSSVDLSGNTGAPFTLPLVLRKDGSGLHVYLEHGAPSALNIPLQATGGSLSASSVAIAVGETMSPSVTFTSDNSGDTVVVSFGGTLPSAGTGVQLSAGGSLTLAEGICPRTAQVRDAILAQLPHNDCSAVTSTELAGIDGLELNNTGIASLQAGDFSGLSSLTSLNLRDNALTSLAVGMFSGLSSLTSLNLDSNALTSLPEGVFSGLSSLTILWLDSNALTSLAAGVFGGLSSLEILRLHSNALTTLPAEVFGGLSNLTSLNLDSNGLASFPAGVFSGLSSLETLSLDSNGLASFPAGVFSGLGNLETLSLESNGMASLPDGVFSGLSSLEHLSLENNGLTSFAAGVFSGLSKLVWLRLRSNGLASFPAGVFSGLSNLEYLWLNSNALTNLPEGVFSGLSSLTSLNLQSNGLATLPEGVFGGLSNLETLSLDRNGLVSLPDGVFSGLGNLETLNLDRNGLASLPDGVFSGLGSLTSLNLQSNRLVNLPEGVFSGLSSLKAVRVSGNPGAPFHAALALGVDAAANTIRVLLPLGAPEDLDIVLNLSGGTVAGSATTTVTVATGATASPPVTVGADGVVTVSFGTLPVFTPYSGHPQFSGIDGLTLVTEGTVSYSAGICGLTEQVRTAIRAKLGDKACGRITATDLAGISGTLSINSKSVDSLQAGDFSGLTSLEGLDLGGNSITNLPASLLSNLPALTALNLSDNGLINLPDGLLGSLDQLANLDLSGNPDAPFEFKVDLQLAGRTSGGIEVTAALALEQPLPLPVDVTLEVRSDDMNGQPEILVIPAAGAMASLEIPDTRNSVRITRLRFGPADTGWSGQYQDFAGVKLIAGKALILDAHPYFDETAIADQSYMQNTPIQPWQLPGAMVATPSGVSANSIALTYSLSATTSDGDVDSADSLPAGLAFDAGTRTLTGKPTATGTYRMTYSVVEGNDEDDRVSLQFEVTVGRHEALYRQLHAQILSQYALTIATEAGRAVAERVDRLAQGQEPRFATNADGSEFEIPLSSRGGSWSLWRRDNGNDLSWKSASTWSWDGSITSWQMGADRYANDSSWLAGFMVQNAEGEFGYSGGSGLTANLSGDYAVPVQSGHLYAGWAPRDESGSGWISVWGMAGFGSGEVSMGSGRASANLRSDADMEMSHFGVAITPVRLRGGLRVQLRAETVQTTVDLADAGGGALSLDASRQRAFLAVSSPNLLEGANQELLLSGELGSRTDDSGVGALSDLAVGMPDGSGSEIGVKLRYTSKYVTMEVGGRSLSADSGGAGEKFEESGWYLSFSLTPKPGERGLALSLKPSWGNTGSGLDDLWEDEQLPVAGSVGRGAGVGRGSMDAELSYGFGLSGGGEAVLSPYSKISTAEGSAHSGAFGVRLKLGKAFDLNFEHSDQYGAEAQDGRGRFRLGGTLRL